MKTYEAPIDTGAAVPAPPKAPRKPRPSELAAKKAKSKPKAGKKPTFRQVTKKIAKAHPVKKAKKAKRPKRKPGKASAGVVRTERLDLRLLPKEKAKLLGKAKATRRTVTSVVQEMIEKLK